MIGICRRVPTASTTSAFGPERVPAGEHVAQRMTLVEHALAAAIGDDRRGEPLGERAHLRDRLVGAAADEDHRAFGLREQGRRARDRVLVERGLRLGRCRRRRASTSALAASTSGGTSMPTGRGRPDCSSRNARADQAGRVLRLADAVGPFGQRAQDADLVGDLVQEAVAFADRAARDLADQRKHARAGRIGGGERRGRVEETRTRHHRIDRGLAGRERRAERHVGGALLVAGVDHL